MLSMVFTLLLLLAIASLKRACPLRLCWELDPGSGNSIDSNGSWVQGFAGLCGVKTNLYAELLAILKVLQMAWDYNGQALIYESNSRTALSLTLHGADHTHHYFPLISRIRSFLHHPWELSFQHEFREANYCADWLAKLGASSANHPLVSSAHGFDLLVVGALRPLEGAA
ncbi:hypothetical protein JHK86_040615 [Glycine max]|nr:hypothetical protein JHK86_040615 [Glycine max]